MKTGLVYSGVSYQFDFVGRHGKQFELELVPIWEMAERNLSSVDCLVFPRGTDQEAALRAAAQIRGFLEEGKAVVTFGEVTESWLPGVRWDGVVPEDDGPLSITADHPILAGIRPEDLHWHKGCTGWCCHGHFLRTEGFEVLVTNALGDPVLYVDRLSSGGLIVSGSQVDAVCHAAHGVEAAVRLFGNILSYVNAELRIGLPAGRS